MKEILEQFKNGELEVDAVLTKFDEAKKEALKDMIPRDRLNSKNDEIKDLKAELQERDQQIGKLKDSAKGNEELEKQIEELQKVNSDWETKYKETQINAAVKLAAKDANDPDDILAFVNTGGLALKDDGTVEGLEDALNQLKESKPYLFATKEEPKLKGREPNNPDNSEPKTITKEQFQQMGYSDRVKLYNDNPELYSKLNQ